MQHLNRLKIGARLTAGFGALLLMLLGIGLAYERLDGLKDGFDIGEIAAAEQSDGIGQVNTAVTQLDQMTQQNAALVEQSAAAAESLKDQALRLQQSLAGFRLQASAA
jgi:methyl-accepting chemotaxis protein